MPLGEKRQIQKRTALERSRRISNAIVCLALSFIVSESGGERIKQEGRILGSAPVVTSESGYKILKRDAEATVTILNAP